MTVFTLYPVSTSAQIGLAAGVNISYNPSLMRIGQDSQNFHGLMNFDVSSISPTLILVSASLRSVFAAKNGTNPGIDLWASDLGAGITSADYNLPASNSSPYKVYLKQVFAASAVAADVSTVVVPIRFASNRAAVGLRGFEYRPTTPTGGATDWSEVFGPGAEVGYKPALLITALLETEIDAQNSYRTQAVGAESYVAFDIETTAGEAVKAKNILDARNIGLDSYAENLVSAALTQERARPRKVAVGRAGAGGSIGFEVTPEKCWKLLRGLMKLTGTVDNGDGSYTHTFGPAQSDEVATFTFVSKVGSFRYVYPGGMVDSLRLSADLDSPIMGEVSVQCRDEYQYDENSAGTSDEYILDSGAAYDSIANAMLSFVDAEIRFNSVADRGLCQSFSLDLSQNVRERRGLSRRRSVTSHFPLGFTASIGFSMYFENETRLRKFLGVSASDFPFRAEKDIQFEAVTFYLTGMDENKQIYTFTLPKVMYTVVRKPVNSEDAIMLDVSGVGVFNPSDSTNITVTVRNAEAASAFAASTNTITVLPETLIS